MIEGLEKDRFRKKTGFAVLIGLIAFLVYLPALKNGLVSDDHFIIFQNEMVTGEFSLGKIFSHSFWSGSGGSPRTYYRPFIILSYALEFRLWAENPFGYHLTNLILHSLASVLVFYSFYFWLKEWSKEDLVSGFQAGIAGLIFAVHPAHSQSVLWIAGRTDLFATVFILLGFGLYVLGREKSGRRGWLLLAGSVLAFSLSLLCKEVAIVFPLLLASADYAQIRSVKGLFQRKRLVIYLSLFSVLLIYFLIWRKAVGYQFGYPNWVPVKWYPEGKADVWSGVTLVKIQYYYFKTLLFPIHLSFECKLLPSEAWSHYQIWLSFSVVFLVLAGVIYAWFRSQSLFWAMLWYFIGLLPVANLIPTYEIAMEHFLYLPSAGFCLGLAILLNRILAEEVKKEYLRVGKKFYGILIPILICYFALSWHRGYAWRNSQSLLLDSLKKTPEKVRVSYALGGFYWKEKKYSRARFCYYQAVQSSPSDGWARYQLGKVLAELGKNEEAISELQKTILLNPQLAEAHYLLAELYFGQGHYQSAKQEYETARALKPKLVPGPDRLTKIYLELGDCNSAWQIYNRFGNQIPESFAQDLKQKCPK